MVNLVDKSCLADDLEGNVQGLPRVPAAISDMAQRFLQQEQLVFDLVDGFGSPLNIMFPEQMAENIAGFQQVLTDRQLQGRIYFTSKPNKSRAVIRRAAMTGCGLDVSSAGEAQSALSCGFRPERIEATGPKNMAYLSICVQQGITVNVDNIAELETLAQMHQSLGLSERIPCFVRLDGFKPERVKFTTQDSTFGINVSEAPAVLDMLVEHKDRLDFRGFSFHFNAGDMIRRGPAMEACIELTFEAINRGLAPKGRDIGGGYRINYAATQDDWNRYIEALKSAVLGERDSLTFNDAGLGFRAENGMLRGAPNFMEHWHPKTGPQDLAAVIDQPLPGLGGQTAAQILSESLLELYVEPGRALLDQVGLTLARVSHAKPSMEGDMLIALEMNRTNLNSTQLKCMTDPVLLYRGGIEGRASGDQGVLYVGNLCLTHDMIQYHKTFPQAMPQHGDVVAFINTAAYQMDFAETPVLQQSMAEKLAVVETEQGRFRWFKDEQYNPIALAMGD
ncbi:MAG: Y4yA family PLP-dependent enzyme [Alphaproteobacteria bacterium]